MLATSFRQTHQLTMEVQLQVEHSSDRNLGFRNISADLKESMADIHFADLR